MSQGFYTFFTLFYTFLYFCIVFLKVGAESIAPVSQNCGEREVVRTQFRFCISSKTLISHCIFISRAVDLSRSLNCSPERPDRDAGSVFFLALSTRRPEQVVKLLSESLPRRGWSLFFWLSRPVDLSSSLNCSPRVFCIHRKIFPPARGAPYSALGPLSEAHLRRL